MRIIAGSLGSRKLRTVGDAGLRPAMGKTREALFSMLEARGVDWENVEALDLFAGCGSLGFECLSRGARRAVFVENASRQYECLLDNARTLGQEGKCSIFKEDVRRFLRQKPFGCFNLVFLDPPYRRNLAQNSLNALLNNGWLMPDSIIIAELEKEAEVSVSLGEPERRFFGQTVLNIWGINENSAVSGDI